VYVKTTVKRRGETEYTYLSLVEAVRDGRRVTQRTLLRLGEVSELRSSGQLDRIIEALSRHAEGTWCQASAISAAPDAPAVGAIEAAYAYWCQLGLDEHFARIGKARRSSLLADAVFVMVANRLIDPCSKRRAIGDWLRADVVAPQGVKLPSLQGCYRALDVVAEHKEATEAHLFSEICSLVDLDLRLGLYDLTSSYFEGDPRPSTRFPSKAFGYSRDHRSDRPQVMLGLLTTTEGIPISHHVFPGNTRDSSTLPVVAEDLSKRFGVGRLCLVADRGIITADNLNTLSAAGIDYVLATRLRRDELCEQALAASVGPSTAWVPVASASSFATEVAIDNTRCVVVASPERWRRDTARTKELVKRTEEKLVALEWRVRDGELADPGKIGRAAQRILGASGVARLFSLEIGKGPVCLRLRPRGDELREGTALRALRAHGVASGVVDLDSIRRHRLPRIARRRGPFPGTEGLLGPSPRPALHRVARTRAHRSLRAGGHDRGAHGTGPAQGRCPRPGPSLPTPHGPARPW